MIFSRRHFTGCLLVLFFVLAVLPKANALPAFARKYGLRCSACHEAWPMLNYFGQKFKDNGYQLMNDRDSPIWQNPSYWPVTFRITPYWHRESADKVGVDSVTGNAASAPTERQVNMQGFDLSGLDFHTGGTLEKNFSFYVLPSSDPTAAFHFETAMARLDNLAGSPWLNIKLGKFELDNLISEKRILTLTSISGVYQTYHFIPQGDANVFGQIGDNQLGLEYMGHSADDRTRVSAALLSTNDGNVNLVANNAYSGFFTASQAFDAGKLGVQRLGMYAMVGAAPITFLTSGGVPVVGAGSNNKDFYRVGFVGEIYLGNLDFLVLTQHGYDNVWFGQGFGNATNPDGNGTACSGTPTSPCGLNYIPGTYTLPPTARAPTWNGYMVETHYVYNPQLIFIQRSEWERVSQQASTTFASNFGNLDMYTFGFRWYPIMLPRAGFAFHNEYSWMRQNGTSPVTGTDLTTSSLVFGWDFDF
ncbi:MAG TPA: hypothetical protein VEF05_12185 [Terriglobales bacterium]|nr:hypothetical protein [Terriglobales bacterium]